MFLDLNGFKDIIDSLGHDAGDQLLKTIGKRLADQILRGADFVARFSGDEFCMIIECKKHDLQPEHLALFPDDDDSSESLLQCTVNVMYAVKNQANTATLFLQRGHDLPSRLQVKPGKPPPKSG